MYILCSNEILKANFIVADTSYHTQRVNDGWFDRCFIVRGVYDCNNDCFLKLFYLKIY
jgi:hypothetical protein